MFVRRLVVMATAAILLPAAAVMAQSTTPSVSTGLIGERLAANTIANMTVNASADDAVAQGARSGVGSARKYVPRVFAGIYTSNGSGFELGAGVSTRPFSDAKHELQGNAAFLRVEGTNGFAIDVDYLYNFLGNNVGDFSPYAGGGIFFNRFSSGDCNDFEDETGLDVDCSFSDTGLQIGGGLKKSLQSGKEFFAEIYFAFTDGDPIILRAGIGW